ncbi:hypothetical protein F7984_15475 [Pradoshia sp. D12]|nr:hypothetical protein A8L44_14855 [Bacillus sp. FJAT-27986]QFK72548.1 hypothetical protein F7984_15475 [Pradoshia sp. D12]TPF70708.1 hypothetical protein FHY44_15745 [Bacillus sp. D12]
MNRKIRVFLFVFFCYLLWLYFAIYESSIYNWWTVNVIKHATDDTVQIGVSLVKVFVGTVIFTLSGFIFYLLLRKRS